MNRASVGLTLAVAALAGAAIAAAALAGCMGAGGAGQVQSAPMRAAPIGAAGFKQALPESPGSAGVPPASRGRAKSESLEVAVSLGRHPPNSPFGLQYLTSDVATLAVGLFDRGAAVPVFGLFYPGAITPTTANPLSATAFAALQGAIGSTVPVVESGKAEARRYLLRTQAEPGAAPATIRFANFPRLTGGARARGYNLFAAAFDSADSLIGFHEEDLDDAALASGAVAFDLALDYGVGQVQAVATVSGSDQHPLSGLGWLLVGVFDSGGNPRLGYVQDGAGNAALADSRTWLSALASFLSNQGLGNTTDTGRYCIRAFQAPIAGGATAVTFRNLPPGSGYRPFILALEGTADVGHLLGAALEVGANATASVDLGTFTTDSSMAGPTPAPSASPAPGGGGSGGH